MICCWPLSLNHLAHSEFNHAKESVALSNVFAKELQLAIKTSKFNRCNTLAWFICLYYCDWKRV